MTNREDESKMEVTDAMVNSACMSYRHDFGLLPELDREALRRTARWWLEAWQKEGFVLSNPSQGERVETPSPQNNGTLTDETIDRVAAAIEGAQISHSLKLTRLVDGISTYTVTVDSETHEFVDTDTENAIDQAYAHIRAIKQRCQAEAVIAALAATEGSADV